LWKIRSFITVRRALRIEELALKTSSRKLPVGDPPVLVALQGLEGDRPEELLRRGEAGEEPLEVDALLDAAAELVGEERLGGARGTDEEDVGPGEERAQRPLDHLVALEEHRAELPAHGRELFEDRGGAGHGQPIWSRAMPSLRARSKIRSSR